MKRHSMFRWFCLLVVSLECFADTQTKNQPPHVLIIYADQHRFDCLGAMGNRDVQTPNLDALAKDGILFRNAFATWPVCTPSRYSFLTGQYVRQHRGNSNRATLFPGTLTIANILRGAGYRTKAVGKMHFTPAYLDVGFSQLELAEQNGRGRFVDDYHRYLKERNLIDSVDLIDQEQPYRGQAPEEYWKAFGSGASNLPEEHHSTTWIGNRAVEAISSWRSDQPSLLMVGFIKPHHPFDPPASRRGMYDPEKLTILPGWIETPLDRDMQRRGYFENRTLTAAALRRVMADYYATISQLDSQVGRMIEVLKRQGLYGNSLIIYSGDHGEYMGFHHMLLKGNFMYDPLIKVPLIVKLPRQRHAGTVSQALVSTIDVSATILNETGQAQGPDMRGRPLEAMVAGKSDSRDHVFAEDGEFTMVRSKARKFLFSSNAGRSMFFDLEKDPLEMENIYSHPEYQKEIQAFKDTLLRWYQRETRSEPYLWLEARQINQPNVPKDIATAEREMEEYIRRQMRAVLKK